MPAPDPQPDLDLIPATREEAARAIAACLDDLIAAYTAATGWIIDETLRGQNVPETAYEGCVARVQWAGERLDDWRRLSGESRDA